MKRTWNILDAGSVWMKEFASALQETEVTNVWSPRFQLLGAWNRKQVAESIADPPLRLIHYPLQRGYARKPIKWLMPYEGRLVQRLLDVTPCPQESPLVCTTPFYAPVAERWPGPVIYYSTDLTAAYPNLDRNQVHSLDRRLCRRAEFVCPNSHRIATYFLHTAGCDPEKITVIPNATRESNVLSTPQAGPGLLPADLAHLSRPIVGVLGDLSANTDWSLLLDTVRATPQFQWVFVGPTRPLQGTPARLRQQVQRLSTFVGPKPYSELQAYARCFDVAVLPYLKSEPTFSGSSTRFYEHLAAGRPMVGTRGFAELSEKEGLITLIDSAEELVTELNRLHAVAFQDGGESARWLASKHGTWQERSCAMRALLG